MLLGDRAQLPLDVVERELGHLEEHQPLGSQANDLAAQFRADRSAGARHHDHLVADAGLEQAGLRRDRIAAQKVAHIDFADVLDVSLAGHQLLELRDGLNVDAQGLEGAQDLASAAAGEGRQREQHPVDATAVDERRQLVRRVDLDAVDHPAVQAPIVVDEDDRVERTGGGQDRRQSRSGVARPVDGYSRLGRLNVAGEEVVAHHESGARDVKEREARIDGHHAHRQCRKLERGAQDRQEDPAQCDGQCDGENRFVAQETDHRPVQTESHEDGKTDRNDRQVGGPVRQIEHRPAGFETHRRPERQRDGDRVRADGDEAFGRARQFDRPPQGVVSPYHVLRSQREPP